MLWMLETSNGSGQNVWWNEPDCCYTANFGDATVYAAKKEDLPPYPNANWVALDMSEWLDD